MDYRYLIYGTFLYMFGQFFAWLQSYGPLIFPKLKDNTWILYVTAPAVTFFIYMQQDIQYKALMESCGLLEL